MATAQRAQSWLPPTFALSSRVGSAQNHAPTVPAPAYSARQPTFEYTFASLPIHAPTEPIVQRAEARPGDTSGDAVRDQVQARFIRDFYSSPEDESDDLLLAGAEHLQQLFSDAAGSLTRVAAARALLDRYQELQRRKSPEPLAEPFNPTNVTAWKATVSVFAPAPARRPAARPRPAGAEPAAGAQGAPIRTAVTPVLVEQKESIPEQAAVGELGGGQETAAGIQHLRSVNLAAINQAVVDRANQVATVEGRPPDTRARNVHGNSTLLEAAGTIWFVGRRLYPVDRSGHLYSEQVGYHVSGSSLALGATYYFGTFLFADATGGEPYFINVLLRIDRGAPEVAGGDVYASTVLGTLLPLMEEANEVLKRGGGLGLIVSKTFGEVTTLSSHSLGEAFKLVPHHLGWAVMVRVLQAADRPWAEIGNQLVGHAMQILLEAVPVLGQAIMAYQALKLAAWAGDLTDVAGRARTRDEIDFAAQEIARSLANFALDWAVQTGLTGLRSGIKVAVKGPAPKPGEVPKVAPGERPRVEEPPVRTEEPVTEEGKRDAERRRSEEEQRRAEEERRQGEEPPPGRPRRLPDSLSGCRVGSLHCDLDQLRNNPRFQRHLDERPTHILGEQPLDEALEIRSSLRNETVVPGGVEAYGRYLETFPDVADWPPAFAEAKRRIDFNPHARPGVDYIEVPVHGGTERWPLDEHGRPWQVHHEPPLDCGGGDAPRFWRPIADRDHLLVSRWWVGLKQIVREQFVKSGYTRGEVRAMIGDAEAHYLELL